MKIKGFLIAMIIFGTPFLVISLSTFWYYAGLGPKATVNYGTMINPPVDLGSLELELDYQPLNIDSMERKWMIIHFIDERCNEACLEAFYVFGFTVLVCFLWWIWALLKIANGRYC